MKTTVWRSVREACVMTLLVLGSLLIAEAQVRSSTNYQIQSDSINLGGGLSSSSNYVQESTFGEIATGRSSSTNFSLRAGYQQMQEVFISLNAAASTTMTGPLGGLTGGESNGSSTVTVVTDSSGGYQLSIVASTTPALRKDPSSIADYVPNSAPNPDFLFTTDAGEAHFGFSSHGSDVPARFRHDGGNNCNTGGITTTALRCWVGLSTTELVIARGAGANHPEGATTTLQFKVGIGSGATVESGTYVATTTLTAVAL